MELLGVSISIYKIHSHITTYLVTPFPVHTLYNWSPYFHHGRQFRAQYVYMGDVTISLQTWSPHFQSTPRTTRVPIFIMDASSGPDMGTGDTCFLCFCSSSTAHSELELSCNIRSGSGPDGEMKDLHTVRLQRQTMKKILKIQEVEKFV